MVTGEPKEYLPISAGVYFCSFGKSINGIEYVFEYDIWVWYSIILLILLSTLMWALEIWRFKYENWSKILYPFLKFDLSSIRMTKRTMSKSTLWGTHHIARIKDRIKQFVLQIECSETFPAVEGTLILVNGDTLEVKDHWKNSPSGIAVSKSLLK